MKMNEIFEDNSGKTCGKCDKNTVVHTKKGWHCSNCDEKGTNETATAGGTSAGGVAGFAVGIGSPDPKKKKKSKLIRR